MVFWVPYGRGSKPYTPDKHQNRWQGVHPPQNGYDPWPNLQTSSHNPTSSNLSDKMGSAFWLLGRGLWLAQVTVQAEPLRRAFLNSQRLLGLSMEDPTPPLDTPEVVGVSRPGCLKALNQSGASGFPNISPFQFKWQ